MKVVDEVEIPSSPSSSTVFINEDAITIANLFLFSAVKIRVCDRYQSSHRCFVTKTFGVSLVMLYSFTPFYCSYQLSLSAFPLQNGFIGNSVRSWDFQYSSEEPHFKSFFLIKVKLFIRAFM